MPEVSRSPGVTYFGVNKSGAIDQLRVYNQETERFTDFDWGHGDGNSLKPGMLHVHDYGKNKSRSKNHRQATYQELVNNGVLKLVKAARKWNAANGKDQPKKLRIKHK